MSSASGRVAPALVAASFVCSSLLLAQDDIPDLDFGRGIYNAAKAKPVVATSDDSAGKNWGSNATDGKSSTVWKPKPGDKFPYSLRLNMKRELSAKSIVLQWDTEEAVQYEIEGSTNGTDWTEVMDATGNEEGSFVSRHDVKTSKTQYLRITITGAAGEKMPGLREWAVYEDPARIPKPVQDAAKGILPKAKPKEDPEPDPKPPEPDPKPDPKKMTKTDPKPDDPKPKSDPKPEPKKSGPRPAPSDVTVAGKFITPTTDDPLLKSVRVTKDYEATIFARPPEVNYPTFVKATPAGEVFVSSDKNGALGREKNRGKVQKLIDKDGDGVADEFFDFIPDLDSPRGLEWDGEWLYVVHPPHLSAWRDTDGDHVADESRRLVTNLSFGIDDRGADHVANGITLGIDGWLYIAIGDFGIYEASDADGGKLTHRGGGVARVRPDGTGLHVFAKGTRNIYDVAVSPLLDAFARDNTNDGAGWNVRFHHFTGLEDHGYPSLFKNFPNDAVPPLAEHKTGAGTGAVWVSEMDAPLTCDWETNRIYRHELEAHGASFVQKAQHEFVQIPKPTDVDVDATGRLFVSSWKNGSYKFTDENVGFIARVAPKKPEVESVLNFKESDTPILISHLKGGNHLTRLHAQRELLRRDDVDLESLKKVISEATGSVHRTNPIGSYSAHAALYTLAQIRGEESFSYLLEVAKNPDSILRAAAFRALGDREKTTDHEIFKVITGATDPEVVNEILVAMTRTRTRESDLVAGVLKHAIHKDPLVAHTAVETLVKLDAQRTCVSVIGDKARSYQWPGALKAMSRLHSTKVVQGITGRLKAKENPLPKKAGYATLARLYNREGTWNGESWGARPETIGPYYNRSTWSGSSTIASFLKSVKKGSYAEFVTKEMARNHVQSDSLSGILKLVAKTPSMEESTIQMILKRSEPPADVYPFLFFVASHPERDGELRVNAALALSKSKDAMALDTALETLAVSKDLDASDRSKKKLREAIFENSTLRNRYPAMIEHAFSPNETIGKLAWAILKEWLKSEDCSPNMKAEIEEAFERAKKDPAMRARM